MQFKIKKYYYQIIIKILSRITLTYSLQLYIYLLLFNIRKTKRIKKRNIYIFFIFLLSPLSKTKNKLRILSSIIKNNLL